MAVAIRLEHCTVLSTTIKSVMGCWVHQEVHTNATLVISVWSIFDADFGYWIKQAFCIASQSVWLNTALYWKLLHAELSRLLKGMNCCLFFTRNCMHAECIAGESQCLLHSNTQCLNCYIIPSLNRISGSMLEVSEVLKLNSMLIAIWCCFEPICQLPFW